MMDEHRDGTADKALPRMSQMAQQHLSGFHSTVARQGL